VLLMPIEDPPFVLQGDAHPAIVFRHALGGLLAAPVTSFAGGVSATGTRGAHGVCGGADMAVAQNGTPNMTVLVAAGHAFIRGTEATVQDTYAVYNDSQVGLSIGVADPALPRNDLICVQVRDSNYSGAALDARTVVVPGTPNASPTDPSLAAFPNALVLARVRVNAAATSIVTANITDLRTRAAAVGGTLVCTSTTRPTGLGTLDRVEIFEIDTGRVLWWNGTAWIRTAHLSSAGRTGASVERIAGQTIPNATATTVTYNAESFDSDGFIAPGGSTFTIPAGLGGLYVISMSGAFLGTGGNGYVRLRGSGALSHFFPVDWTNYGANITFVVARSPGDTLFFDVWHSSGAGRDLTSAKVELWRLQA
jgi:hypothetical protein